MKRRRAKATSAVLAAVLACLVLAQPGLGAGFLDPSFGAEGISKPVLPTSASAAEAGISDLEPGPDGTVIGALKGLASRGYFGAVRLTGAGVADPDFGTAGYTQPFDLPWEGIHPEAEAEALALQADGKVVLAGFSEEEVRHPTTFGPLLVRYQADGSLDPGFGRGGIVGSGPFGGEGILFHDLAVAAGGRIIAVGGRNEHSSSLGVSSGVVLAYQPDGRLDSSFGKVGRVLFPGSGLLKYSSLRSIAILPSGKILVAGYRSNRLFLARLTTSGRLDRGFSGDGIATLGVGNPPCCQTAALAIQPDGRIVVAGNGGPLRRSRVYLVRYRPNGGLDRSFGKNGVQAPFSPWRLSEVTDVAVQGNGGILTVGRGEKTKANPRGFAYSIFRNRPNGRPDRSFGQEGLLTLRQGGESYAGAALTLPDGGVLTGGSFATSTKPHGDYVTTLLLARLLGP